MVNGFLGFIKKTMVSSFAFPGTLFSSNSRPVGAFKAAWRLRFFSLGSTKDL